MKKNSGQELWQKAKQIIPGGNQLLSKRPERFLPGLWPTYYSKAKGCEVWDLDNNHYFDFAQMGVGSCVLGFADEDVNRAVVQVISNGSMSSLNCPEEVRLAEKLIELHPWADMARFTRAGGEACAVAVRIARAASGKEKVAFCGYHGWHDWYLAANLDDDKNLDGQLLPGLEPNGVPRGLKGTSIPFHFNNLDELSTIVEENPNQIGVIYMEPCRHQLPTKEFIQGVRDIASKIGAVLIFDEVTSGFRMNIGGIHLILGVQPDIAVLGKALGNGFAISAVIGRRSVMDAAQNSFISSTFWTERVGPTAALATIEKMQKYSVPEKLSYYGKKINEGWEKIAKTYELSIDILGIPPLTHLSFKTAEPSIAQTFYAQEMLKKGYLLGASIYTTYAYNDSIIDKFLFDTDSIFNELAKAIRNGNLKSKLQAEPLFSGFKRLA